MPEKLATTHVLLENELIVYRRERSTIWQCRFKVGGFWQRASTKERKLNLAKVKAKDLMITAEIALRRVRVVQFAGISCFAWFYTPPLLCSPATDAKVRCPDKRQAMQ